MFKNRRIKWRSSLAGVLVLAGIALGLAACSSQVATSSATCGFVSGDGQGGDNSNLHHIVWPGQVVNYSSDSEVATYVPCNSRNYIINDGSITNANGQRVGDRFKPSLAYTDNGSAISIWSSTYWTLNETQPAMTDFFALCLKYSCANDDNNAGGSANFSSQGWNGMLGENFGQTIDSIALQAAATIPDAIWQKHDPNLYTELGNKMSSLFQAQIAKTTGYNEPLFCGSGNSYWVHPNDRVNGWKCSTVRIVINQVDYVPPTQTGGSNNPQNQVTQNQNRLNAAQALYGGNASYWLGLQDTMHACAAHATCVLNVNPPGSTATTVPGTNG